MFKRDLKVEETAHSPKAIQESSVVVLFSIDSPVDTNAFVLCFYNSLVHNAYFLLWRISQKLLIWVRLSLALNSNTELTVHFQEANPPRTTLQSWTEKTTGPEQVTVEKDQFGNVIK